MSDSPDNPPPIPPTPPAVPPPPPPPPLPPRFPSDFDSPDDAGDAHGESDHDAIDPVTGGTIHLPGAGGIGMFLLLASLSILFLASMVALVFIRAQSPSWPPTGLPRIPSSLWLSTFVILAASFTVQKAHWAIQRDDEKRLARYLTATFVVGILFLLIQTVNWVEFYLAIRNSARMEGAYLGMFYVLTGLHAAHVVGGLIPLAMVLTRAKQGRYSRNFHPGVRYMAIYWHFLDVIWVVLFFVIYF